MSATRRVPAPPPDRRHLRLLSLSLAVAACGPRSVEIQATETPSGRVVSAPVTPASTAIASETHDPYPYRPPRPSPGPTPGIAPTRSAAESTIGSVLPPGATFELDELTDWSWVEPGLRALPFRHADAAPDLAVLDVGTSDYVLPHGAVRLIWLLGRTAAQGAQSVLPARVSGHGAGIHLTGDASELVLVDADTWTVGWRLPLPVGPITETVTFATALADFDGDGLDERLLWLIDRRADQPGPTALTVYSQSNGLATPVLTAPLGTRVRLAGERAEVIVPEDADNWTVLALGADGFAKTDDRSWPASPQITVNETMLPPIPRDLFFYRPETRSVHQWVRTGGRLRQLRQGSDSADWPLVTTVDNWAPYHPIFRVSEHNALVAVLASPRDPHAAAAFARFNLLWSEPITATIRASLGQWELSADGTRVIYAARGALSLGAKSRRASDADDAELVFFDWRSRQPISLAKCEPAYAAAGEGDWRIRCGRFAVSSDWTRLAYSDGRGLWLTDTAGGTPRLLLEHERGDDFGTGWQIYRPRAWSPDDRWLVLEIGHYEGSTLEILNLESGVRIRVPNSSTYAEAGARIEFSADSRLAIVARTAHTPPVSVVDLATGADVPARFALDLQLDSDTGVPAIGAEVSAYNPTLTDGNLFRFGLVSANGAYPGTGLYTLDARGALRRLAAGLQPYGRQLGDHSVIWGGPDLAIMARFDGRGAVTHSSMWQASRAATLDFSSILAGGRWPQWGASRATERGDS